MADCHECPASSLKVFGQPLIVRNVQVVNNILGVDKVMIPQGFSDVAKLIHDNFPSIDVEQFCDDSNYSNDNKNKHENNNSYNISNNNESSPAATTTIVDTYPLVRNNGQIIKREGYNYNNKGKAKFEVAVNTFIHYSLERASFLIDSVVYPWDFLKIIQKVLYENIRETRISPNASIAKSSIIEGPCIIEDGVTIDDFCKIKGPTYIGKGSFIGMSSLIRNCMLGEKTRIGFNCEIARSYFAGCDKMAHQNVILDSIIGQHVWFGGYSGTANVLLNQQNIRYEVYGKLIDTGTNHFGAIVGNNCAIGAAVIILPGRQVPSNSIIQAGTIFGKKCI